MKRLGTAILTSLVLIGCSSSSDPVDTTNSGDTDNSVIDDEIDGGTTDEETSTINATNHEQILKEVITAVNLNAIDQTRKLADEFDDDLFNSEAAMVLQQSDQTLEGLTLASDTRKPDGSVELSYSCNGEGSLTSLFHDLGGSGIVLRDLDFDNCLATDTLRDGQYQFRTNGNKSDRVTTLTGYSAIQNTTEQFLSGEWTVANTFIGDSESQYWSDATFRSQGTADDFSVDAFNWHREGGERPLMENTVTGYVQDLEGNVAHVELAIHSAELQADFTFSNATTGNTPVTVDVSLIFSSNYFIWNNHDYPVSDLGSPLTISSTEDFSADVRTVDNPARDNEAQWQTGELTVSAEDGSTVSLRPSSEDKLLLEIELNASGDRQTHSWSEGFTIDCPSKVDGCGDAAVTF